MADPKSSQAGPSSEPSGNTIETATTEANTGATTMDKTTVRSYALAERMIALNHAGVRCLEGRHIFGAIKAFSHAYRTYERLRESLLSVPESQSIGGASPELISRSHTNKGDHHHLPTTAKVDRRAPLRSLSATSFFRQRSSNPQIVSVAGNPIVQSLDAMLLAAHRRSSDTANSDRPAGEGIFRAPIKLPLLENLPLFGSSKDPKKCPTFAFLATCHVYNLALAQHLRGIELLEIASMEDRRDLAVFGPSDSRDDSGDKRSLVASKAREHLCRSGRLYEHVMRNELSGCRLEVGEQHSSMHTHDDILKVTLACLNNLGHLHGHTQNPELARSCFNRVQRIIEKLGTSGHQLNNHKQHRSDSSGNNVTDGGDHRWGAGSYLDFFWDMTSQSLLLLDVATQSTTTTISGVIVTGSKRQRHATDDETREDTASTETSNSNRRRKRSKISDYAPAA